MDETPPSPAPARAVAVSFAAIALIGFALRVVLPGVVDLDDDMSGRIVHSRKIVTGEERPLLGRELSGLLDRGRHGPAMDYIEALPFVVSSSPLTIPWWVALLHVVGMWAVYRLGRELGSPYVGLLAALSVALSSFLLYWTRRVMNPSYLAFWMPLIYLLLWRVLTVPRSRAWVPLALTFGLASQFHLVVVNVLPAAALLAVLFRPRISWAWLAAGVAVGLAVYSPLVIAGFTYDDWEHLLGFVDLLHGDLGGGPPVWAHVLEPLDNLRAWSLMGGLEPGEPDAAAVERYHLGGRIVIGGVLAGTAVLVTWLLVTALRRRRPGGVDPGWRGATFVLVLVVVQSALLANIRTGFYPRYVITIVPLLHLLLALGVDRAARVLAGVAGPVPGALVRALGVGCVLVGSGMQLSVDLGILSRLDRAGKLSEGRPTTGVQQELARVLVDELGFRDPRDVIVRMLSTTGREYGLPALITLRAERAEPPTDRRTVILSDADRVADLAEIPGVERFRVGDFALIAVPSRMDPLEMRVASRPEGAWYDPGYDDAGWRGWIDGHHGRAEDEWIGVRVPMRVEPGDPPLSFTLWSRACVEHAWLDGVPIYAARCSRERATEERDRDRTTFELGSPAPGAHLLAFEGIVRDKWFDLRYQLHPSGVAFSPAPTQNQPTGSDGGGS